MSSDQCPLPSYASGVREFDQLLKTRKGVAFWLLLAALTMFQTVRFGSFMVDSRLTWGSAFPLEPSSVHHMCLPAYLYAAELAARNIDAVYSQGSYRAYSADGSAATAVVGMGPWIEDPFLYPPPFLLLPRFALWVSLDYLVLRTAWYGAQALALLALLVVLARWVGGREGARLGLLAPLLWISIPTMFNLQYGQFQLAAVVLALFARIRFTQERRLVGGFALAFATISKVFPGVFLVEQLARRRYRELGSTLGWCFLLTALALVVFGHGPFVEYFGGMASDVASGAATRFVEEDFPTVLNNISIYGIVIKLRWLGVAGMSSALASGLVWFYTLIPLGLAVWLGLRTPDSRLAQVQCWVALLNLATLRSPNAPGAYALVGSLLLLLLLTPFVVDGVCVRRWRLVGLVAVWLLCLGTPPLPTRKLVLAGSMVTQFLVLLFNAGTLVFWIRRSNRAGTVAASASGDSR